MTFLPSKISKKDQERALGILYSDFYSDYESILNKSGKSTILVKQLRTFSLEVLNHEII